MCQDIEAFSLQADPAGPEHGLGWSESMKQLLHSFIPELLANIKHFYVFHKDDLYEGYL